MPRGINPVDSDARVGATLAAVVSQAGCYLPLCYPPPIRLPSSLA